MPRVARADPDLPHICTTEQARAAGLTKDQIRQRVRSGRWQRIAHGVYVRSDADAVDESARLLTSTADINSRTKHSVDARSVHFARAIAASITHPEAIIGYESAALIHGLPLSRSIPEYVSLCVPAGHWLGCRAGVHFRVSSLPESAIVEQSPRGFPEHTVRLVSAAYAWTQSTSKSSLSDGLVMGDAGLRRGLFTTTDLENASASLNVRRGSRILSVSLAHLNAKRESPLESQSWAYFVRNRLPLPELQVEIFDEYGQFVGRVDVLWKAQGVIGEVDGRGKYLSPDDIYREKRREDALRALGFDVIRWGAQDLRTRALAVRLARVLGTSTVTPMQSVTRSRRE